jgi:flagellar protein FliS
MSDLRAQYLKDAVTTATPMQLVTMLYDRMLLDLHQGVSLLEAGDIVGARIPISHAGEIIAELMGTLDASQWAGADGLMGLYTWALAELLSAEITGDAEKVAACRDAFAPLADAWHEAASGDQQPVVAAAGATAGRIADVLGVG